VRIEEEDVREHAVQAESHAHRLLFGLEMHVGRVHGDGGRKDGLKEHGNAAAPFAGGEFHEVLAQGWNRCRCRFELFLALIADLEDPCVAFGRMRELCVSGECAIEALLGYEELLYDVAFGRKALLEARVRVGIGLPERD